MKIDKIEVNGIRGFKDYTSGDIASPMRVETEKKCLFVLGENGNGKSSLYDALEWGITGAVLESKLRNINNYPEYLINNDTDFENQYHQYIRLIFDNGYDLTRSITARTTAGGNVSFQSGNWTDISKNCEYCFVDAQRIDNFVLSAKSDLWRAFSELLNFDRLIKFDKQVALLKKDVGTKLSALETDLNSKKNSFQKLCNSILDYELEFKNTCGDNWETEIQTIYERKEVLDQFEKLSKSLPVFYESKNNITKLNDQIIEKSFKLESMDNPLNSHQLLIINGAIKYFEQLSNIEKCPICQSTIDKDILANLKEIESKNQEQTQLTKDKNNLENNLSTEKTKLASKIRDIILTLNLLELTEYIVDDPIEQEELLYNNVDELYKKIRDNTQHHINDIERYLALKEQFQKNSKELEDISNEYLIMDRIYGDIAVFHEDYAKNYKSKIKKELQSLSRENIFQIYNEINRSPQDEHIEGLNIDVENLDDTNPQITFNIQTREKSVSALKYLSTGHLKCLGFAILIARFLLKNPKLKTIVFDDPIHAIDHDHRYNLIEYLYKLNVSEKIQLIIFSSDRLFYEILVQSFHNNLRVAYECTHSDLGVVYNRDSDFLGRAKKHLREKKDIRSSALYCRLALENELVNAAKKVNLKVKYGKNIGMKQLVDECNLKGKLIEKNKDHAELIRSKFEELEKPKSSKVLLGSFALDQEVHYPHEMRDVYTTSELEKTIELVEEFIDLLQNLPYTDKVR